MNVFLQRDSVGCVLRAIPYEIVDFDELGLPPAVKTLGVPAAWPRARHRPDRFGQVDDARVADRHREPRALGAHHDGRGPDRVPAPRTSARSINQREVGEDTHSFADALKHVLRQDPDVILVGEMRDLETISTALTAAETGHLVFATLHTQDAPQSIDRVIDVFPAHQQQQVRVQLASALQGICTQQLAPDRRRPGPRGRVRGDGRDAGGPQPHP